MYHFWYIIARGACLAAPSPALRGRACRAVEKIIDREGAFSGALSEFQTQAPSPAPAFARAGPPPQAGEGARGRARLTQAMFSCAQDSRNGLTICNRSSTVIPCCISSVQSVLHPLRIA